MKSGRIFAASLLTGFLLATTALADGSQNLQIVVSKDKQSLAVYDGLELIATSRVSTGKPGHSTPSGLFNIIEKQRYHESNLYSSAPMPFMQRITWSGVALHEGKVPNYPASHGCIRLPGPFARSLYSITDRGAQVVITDKPVAPVAFAHPNLLEPHQPIAPHMLLTDAPLRVPGMDSTATPVELASASIAPPQEYAPVNPAPLRILITRRTERDQLRSAQTVLADLGYEIGTPDGFFGAKTVAAIKSFRQSANLPTTGAMMSDDFVKALYEKAARPIPPNGELLIRQNFQPIFEAAITIKEPEKALGTHILTASKVNRGTGTAEWTAISMPDNLPESFEKRFGITIAAEAPGPDSITHVLDRIDIPTDIRANVESMLTEGSSITITDRGVGPETGNGTDFIVVTHPTGENLGTPKPFKAHKKHLVRRTLQQRQQVTRAEVPKRQGFFLFQ